MIRSEEDETMGEAKRRKLSGTSAPVITRRPPPLSARVAPFVFAWCPTCDGRHLTLITAFPCTEPLTDAQTQKIVAVVDEYLGEVASMCAEHRSTLSVSADWSGPRPPDAIRDPRDAPEVMKWRRFNCWLADVALRDGTISDGDPYTMQIFAQGDGIPPSHVH
jgi:hypothetical protein